MGINCHSAYKHYMAFHNRSENCYGIVIQNNNFNCFRAHEGFGKSFLGGVAFGFGNAVASMLGNFGFGASSIFGGYGFGSMYGGYGFPRGGASSASRTTHTCSCKCSSKSEKADKDSPVMERLTKLITSLEKKKTDGKTLDESDLKKLEDAKAELEELKDNPKDKLFETSNKFTYKSLLDRLTKLTATDEPKKLPVQDNKPPVQPVEAPATPPVASSQPVHTQSPQTEDSWVNEFTPSTTIIPNNVPSKLPYGYENVTSDEAKSLTGDNLKKTKDLSGRTADVTNNSGAKVSKQKYEGTEFPLYLQITDSKAYNYRCIGTDESGRAYYATPTSDSNKNVYILTKKNGSFVLLQVNRNFSGFGVGDKQY